MRPFLNQFVRTLSGHQARRVSHVLDEARVSKQRVATLVESLRGNNAFPTIEMRKDTENGFIRSSPLLGNINQVEGRVGELYQNSNIVATTLHSHSSILKSDIKSVEAELNQMEKLLSNYAFLIADNQAYDYAFMEGFDDERNRAETFSVPDRSGLPFGVSDRAAVNTEQGNLSISHMLPSSYPLSVRMVKGNANQLSVHDTGLDNMLKSGTSSGWRMDILSPGRITSRLSEMDEAIGAQVILEFSLDKAAPASEVSLSPYADLPIEVHKILVFEDEEAQEGEDILSRTTYLDRPHTFHFSMRPVQRFQVYLAQPVYHRLGTTMNEIEVRNRDLLHTLVYHMRNVSHTRDPYNSETAAIRWHMHSQGSEFVSPVRFSPLPEYGGMDEDIKYEILSTVMEGFDELSHITHNIETIIESENFPDRVRIAENLSTHPYNYHYNIGLHYVQLSAERPGTKAVFVSKPLPAQGDIGELRIKTSEDHYIYRHSSRDIAQATSVEYSITNKANPIHEVDWLPILPVGPEGVVGERVFVDGQGVGRLRFRALAGQEFHLYVNGYEFDLRKVSIIEGGPASISGFRFPPAVLNRDDIVTCSYYPIGEPATVDLTQYGYDEPSLTYASDSLGPGEGFVGTGARNSVHLTREPYVDRVESQQDGYSPVTVRLESGVVPQNITDYKFKRTQQLPSSGYYYMQSGTTLMFSEEIREPFRVYYQYLQNNTRFRVVLRCNVKDFVTPTVDYVQVKAKTRAANTLG